jgi:hypothetical protein
MSAASNLPTNKNFLSPLGFTFSIKKTPTVNYFCQTAEIPTISLGQADIQTPFVRIPVPGDHIEFGTFTMSFLVDEDLRNYTEIFDWIIALGFPDNFNQFRSVASNTRGQFLGQSNPLSGTGVYSDASLMVLNSVKAPILEVVLKDAYPVSLSGVDFNTQSSDVDYVAATATFAYRSFTLNRLL